MRLPPPKNSSAKQQQQPLQASHAFPQDIVLRSTVSPNVQSAPTDLIPRGPNSSILRADLHNDKSNATALAVQDIVTRKTQATDQVSSLLANAEPKNHTSKFIKINSEVNSFTGKATQERVVRLVEKPVDPLEPAKFRFRAVPKGPGSPPAPILHSPTKKATEEERANWDIPTAISNWNNTRGFVVSLDKRLAQTQSLDSTAPQVSGVNEKFAKLADSLFNAEDVSRTMVEQRFTQRQQNEERQMQEENEKLRIAALEARAMRNRPPAAEASAVDRTDRDLVRAERKRELDREMKLAAAGKRTKQQREEERDISEQVALGMPVAANAGVEFDQRLFSRADSAQQHAGLGSELSRMGDDSDNVYTTSLFNPKGNVYRPSQSVLQSKSGEEMSRKLDELKSTSKFASAGPVLFEKQEDAFLASTSRGGSKAAEALKGLDSRPPTFGLAAGRFASDKGNNNKNRRYEDKEDEQELKEELEMEKQKQREAKKAKIAFVPSTNKE